MEGDRVRGMEVRGMEGDRGRGEVRGMELV